MIKFTKEKILLLHQLIAQETGGDVGLRDQALLESAIESAFAKDLYPTKEEKAARLGYALISNHAFLDGNKRIGVYVMLSFLEVNGVHLDYTPEEVVTIALAIATGTMDCDSLLAWICSHRIP